MTGLPLNVTVSHGCYIYLLLTTVYIYQVQFSARLMWDWGGCHSLNITSDPEKLYLLKHSGEKIMSAFSFDSVKVTKPHPLIRLQYRKKTSWMILLTSNQLWKQMHKWNTLRSVKDVLHFCHKTLLSWAKNDRNFHDRNEDGTCSTWLNIITSLLCSFRKCLISGMTHCDATASTWQKHRLKICERSYREM